MFPLRGKPGREALALSDELLPTQLFSDKSNAVKQVNFFNEL
jgi:hypothetical protein